MKIALAVCLGLMLLFGSCWLSERSRSAVLRDAYRDTVAMDREAARVSDSLAALQRAADSARVAEAALAASRAQGRAQASGRALPRQLPTIPDTVTVLDTAQVRALRLQLADFATHLASHLRDDSVAARTHDSLVAVLKQANANALADLRVSNVQRDRVTNQLAEASKHLKAGHALWVDGAIALAGFAVGHVVR